MASGSWGAGKTPASRPEGAHPALPAVRFNGSGQQHCRAAAEATRWEAGAKIYLSGKGRNRRCWGNGRSQNGKQQQGTPAIGSRPPTVTKCAIVIRQSLQTSGCAGCAGKPSACPAAGCAVLWGERRARVSKHLAAQGSLADDERCWPWLGDRRPGDGSPIAGRVQIGHTEGCQVDVTFESLSLRSEMRTARMLLYHPQFLYTITAAFKGLTMASDATSATETCGRCLPFLRSRVDHACHQRICQECSTSKRCA